LLIGATILFAPVGILGVPGSCVSLFMFDQPGSGRNPFLPIRGTCFPPPSLRSMYFICLKNTVRSA
jgi:hypothetical protein